jgi:hypothetical protein
VQNPVRLEQKFSMLYSRVAHGFGSGLCLEPIDFQLLWTACCIVFRMQTWMGGLRLEWMVWVAAHALGVAANWMVQLVLDIYRSISASLYVRTKDGKPVGLDAKELKRLARRTVGNTLKGIASLLLASLGAGLGTVLIRPSTGTWIGMFASTSILHNGLLNVR